MSLRDQLVAKGLASKRQAKSAERQLKQERKRKQGHKRRQHEVNAEQQAAEQAEVEARRAAAKAQAEADRQAREAHEHRFRVRQIIEGNRLGGRGPVSFHHRVGDTGRIARMRLPEAIVRDLRLGRAAIAGYADDAGELVARVVRRRAADRLAEVEPSAVWHLATDGALDDPAQAPLRVLWEPSLRPHRVRQDGS